MLRDPIKPNVVAPTRNTIVCLFMQSNVNVSTYKILNLIVNNFQQPRI